MSTLRNNWNHIAIHCMIWDCLNVSIHPFSSPPHVEYHLPTGYVGTGLGVRVLNVSKLNKQSIADLVTLLHHVHRWIKSRSSSYLHWKSKCKGVKVKITEVQNLFMEWTGYMNGIWMTFISFFGVYGFF